MSGLDHAERAERLLERLRIAGQPGPWRPDPGVEDDYPQPAEVWLTNPDGDSLLLTDADVADLLNAALVE